MKAGLTHPGRNPRMADRVVLMTWSEFGRCGGRVAVSTPLPTSSAVTTAYGESGHRRPRTYDQETLDIGRRLVDPREDRSTSRDRGGYARGRHDHLSALRIDVGRPARISRAGFDTSPGPDASDRTVRWLGASTDACRDHAAREAVLELSDRKAAIRRPSGNARPVVDQKKHTPFLMGDSRRRAGGLLPVQPRGVSW